MHMQPRSAFSTQKIVTVLVFIIGALLTSVFVFHMRQKPPSPQIAAEIGMLYPAARELKSFELIGAQERKFSHKDLYGHWTLMFFGFTHCANICPNTLTTLNKVYLNLKPRYPNLQIVLVSLDPERDSLTKLDHYARSFNPSFIGVTANFAELRKFQSQFGVFSGVDANNKTGDYQITHTSTINLINPHGQWVGFFRYGVPATKLSETIHQSIRINEG